MKWVSTRRASPPVPFIDALFAGTAPDGGLYMPERLDPLPAETIASLRGRDIVEIGTIVGAHILRDEITPDALRPLVEDALNFSIPLVRVADRVWALELFHGPTLAFKDVGARTQARLLHHFTDGTPLTMLVATSGDTGSAVAQAFHRVPDTRVVVLYPEGKVSDIQEAQMASLGDNITAVAVHGTFDDCQRLVKQAFADDELRKYVWLTPANSINLGRLLPQIFYYFETLNLGPANHRRQGSGGPPKLHAKAEAGPYDDENVGASFSRPGPIVDEDVGAGFSRPGPIVDENVGADFSRPGPIVDENVGAGFSRPGPIVSVPSGNFGSLTAGLMAHRLGLPVRKFVAATNVNDVVPEYLHTGEYRPRPSIRTVANAMDVGAPSNFERMRALYDNDLDRMRQDITGVAFDDARVIAEIGRVYRSTGYLLDPHGAIAWLALQDVLADDPDATGVFLATAHPAKFREVVEPAIGEPVPLPPALSDALARPRHSVRLPAEYPALRKLLHP